MKHEHSFAMATWQAADVVVLNKTDLATKDCTVSRLLGSLGLFGPRMMMMMNHEGHGAWEWLPKSQRFPSAKRAMYSIPESCRTVQMFGSIPRGYGIESPAAAVAKPGDH